MGLNRESRHEWVMKFRAALILAALTAATPALAEITDFTVLQSEGAARFLIRFDSQPHTAAARVDGDNVTLTLAGVSAGAQTVIPPEDAPVETVSIGPDGTMSLRFKAAPDFAQAQLFENAVLLTVQTARAGTAPEDAGPGEGMVTLNMKPPAGESPGKETDTAPAGLTEPGTGAAARADAASETSPAADTPAPPDDLLSSQLPDVDLSDGAAAMFAARLSPAACAKAEKDVATDPWAVQAVKRLAACRARQGETQQARELYERILTFDPYAAEAVAGLGALAQDRGEHALARRKYEEALGMNPGDGLAALIRQLMAEL